MITLTIKGAHETFAGRFLLVRSKGRGICRNRSFRETFYSRFHPFGRSTGRIAFDADVTIHVEDRYNVNLGATDVATGIPDSANGRFEITGLATQYTNHATIIRHVKWNESSSSKKGN